MSLYSTTGVITADAYGGTNIPVYATDVFSPYIYTGNGSTKTITNGINLSGKGGLVWTKSRSSTEYHNLEDTVRGANKALFSNDINPQTTYTDSITAFNTNGYSLGADATGSQVNASGVNYISWTFRKQPKFFDVVTYTGNGNTALRVNHSLGSLPGMIVIKRTDSTSNWGVWHIGSGIASSFSNFVLNSTNAATSGNYTGLHTVIQFAPNYVYDQSSVAFNTNGATYVAYLFAHNAGGFGFTGTENIISCGSYTGNSANQTINCNFTTGARFILIKQIDTSGSWFMFDTARGIYSGTDNYLFANQSAMESSLNGLSYQASGFGLKTTPPFNSLGSSYIYVAIA